MPRLSGTEVVVATPNETDRELTCGFLAGAGIAAYPCNALAEVVDLPLDSIGCLLLVEEALTDPEVDDLQHTIRLQPAWSDLPVLLVAAEATPLEGFAGAIFPQSGNITLLQRPLHPVSLVSAVQVALRARMRQFQVRDLLHARDRAVAQRDEFLAMLAHELRNPLAPIRNAVYLLSTLDVADPLFVKCRAMIEKQARHITRLVDDLLDVSRLELGKVELRPRRLDLNQCAAAAVDACAPATEARGHVVETRYAAEPIFVMGDAVRLEQAICNLVVNAAKFTPMGGRIAVSTRREGDTGVLSVADSGVGIRPDMLESIFDLFTQSEVTIARSQGGLGIGLTLVKRLVELHGGEVHAFSAGLGRGSRFEARLPLATAHSEAEPEHARAAPAATPRKVLIVEDNDDNRESLAVLLRTWNHEVVHAGSGPEAVRCAHESRPDVALIDIGLPGFDGYEVARSIRQTPGDWSRHVRLIALTGYGQASDREKALGAGFDAHLLKPIDPAVLKDILAESLAP